MKAEDRKIWKVWAKGLQQWGIRDLVATFLEAIGPLSILGAQIVYLGQPFVRSLVSEGTISALTQLLEDPDEAKEFSQYLRQAQETEL